MQSPLDHYRQDLHSADHYYDVAQEKVIHHAQALHTAWTEKNKTKPSLWTKLFSKAQPLKGLYIWGGVGRGKTYILDILYQTLPTERKRRVHFHQFMQNIHQDMQLFGNSANPLKGVADKVASEIDALFLDEFFVSDITDAMILAGLLEGLFIRGLTLVATSNIHIDRIYQDGLQRERFLPAIEMIKKHLHIVEITAGSDYRENTQPTKLSKQEEYIKRKLKGKGVEKFDFFKSVTINNRIINAKAIHNQLIWFDFDELCNTPRSAADYIELAKRFKEIIVTSIPVMDQSNENAALRFVHLIDALYDQGVKLVFWLTVPIKELYQGKMVEFQFQRTISRLIEMRSEKYQAKAIQNSIAESPIISDEG